MPGLTWTEPATRYDPAEKRGWHGRWGKSGSPAGEAAQAHLLGLRGKVQLRELHDYDTAAYEREKLDPIRERYTPGQTEAVTAYADHSHEINTTARGGDLKHRAVPEAKTRARIAALRAAMAPLPDDLILLREIKGEHAMSRFSPGDVIADDGFASTTMRPGRFAGGRGDTTVMHILAPKGTPVVWAGRVEDELILDTGTPMVLVSARPGTRRGVTDQNWLVLPPGIAPEGRTDEPG